jgi:hypothetical protein
MPCLILHTHTLPICKNENESGEHSLLFHSMYYTYYDHYSLLISLLYQLVKLRLNEEFGIERKMKDLVNCKRQICTKKYLEVHIHDALIITSFSLLNKTSGEI